MDLQWGLDQTDPTPATIGLVERENDGNERPTQPKVWQVLFAIGGVSRPGLMTR